MTGYFAGGSHEGSERARQTQCFSRIIHLAKLNPKCHMNYSIIFTEISFSPETSNLHQRVRQNQICFLIIYLGYSKFDLHLTDRFATVYGNRTF